MRRALSEEAEFARCRHQAAAEVVHPEPIDEHTPGKGMGAARERTRFRADAAATGRLANTVPLAELRAEEFAAVYCVGGAATAWDFPGDTTLAAIVAALHAKGRPVAGVCHGVLGLTAARTSTGHPIVAQRAVTGISNAEETLTGFDKVVPVLPETRLRELGARYSCAEPLAAHVIVDQNVLTGQNPASAGPLAQAVLAQLH